ncbi:MAG: hypothetical protein Q7S55_04795 [Nanoarchaeota archaeon]|nr:hypothetical protein [Nanoarchaeota archaeon]
MAEKQAEKNRTNGQGDFLEIFYRAVGKRGIKHGKTFKPAAFCNQ